MRKRQEKKNRTTFNNKKFKALVELKKKGEHILAKAKKEGPLSCIAAMAAIHSQAQLIIHARQF